MKPERLFLILSIIGIFLLLILSNFEKPILTGEVSNIKITKNSISLNLVNFQENILIINKTRLPGKIKIGDKIEIYGDAQKSIDEIVIFTDKLICLNC